MRWQLILLLIASSMASAPARAGGEVGRLYVVGYTHLDTQWRWEYPQVIREFLPATLNDNFALIDRYPDYIFNFTGANRYAYLQEYWPDLFARLKHYVAAGRWFPGGSNMEE